MNRKELNDLVERIKAKASFPTVGGSAERMKKQSTREVNLETVVANLSDVFGGFGLTVEDKGKEWIELSMTREYCVPDCIGQMVRVRYGIGISMSDADSNSDVDVTVRACMFRKQCDYYVNEDDRKHIELYYGGIQFDCRHYPNKYREYVECELVEMIESSEERLKTVLGMERIA